MILAVRLLFYLFFTLLSFITESSFANPEDILRLIQKDTTHYFSQYSNPKTGFTPDSSTPKAPASIAATGFHLLALVVAAENGWMEREASLKQAKGILLSLRNKAANEHGFFYHFISHQSGKRVWSSEASSIDTAILIANALVAGQYFKGTAVEKIANELYDRVEWDWMLNGSKLMCHGYKPETGFLPYYWDSYSEHLILQALAIGAREHPAPPECWSEWLRLEDRYKDYNVIYAHSGSLFTYQFSHLFIDFRKIYDLENNYFENSKQATLANRAFCLDNAANYKTYEKQLWGLSACLGPKGYKAYGGKPGRGFHDGTIAPYALFGSLPFTPTESFEAIEYLYKNHKETAYGRSGFRDGLNLDQGWFAKDYIGIDQGLILGMIENHKSELIWKLFMSLESTQRWIRLCNLKDHPPAPGSVRKVEVQPVTAKVSSHPTTPEPKTAREIPVV